MGEITIRKRWAPSQQRNGTTGENNRISVSHAETKQNPLPGEDRSQSKKLRSNSWAECRDKKGPASSRRGNICLDIPSNRTSPITRTSQAHALEPFFPPSDQSQLKFLRLEFTF